VDDRGEIRLLATLPGLVTAKQILEHHGIGPAIGHEVVNRPHQHISLLTRRREQKTGERFGPRIEPAKPILDQKRLDPRGELARIAGIAPVAALEWSFDVAEDLADRPLHVLPAKPHAQRGVSVDHVLPRGSKRFGIDWLLEVNHHLNNVDATIGRRDVVEQHSLLSGREPDLRFEGRVHLLVFHPAFLGSRIPLTSRPRCGESPQERS
jgi:hypothetical protein